MASIFDRFRRREVSGVKAPKTSARGASIEGITTYASSEASSLTIAAVYRAVALRADTMAQLVMEYQRKGPGDNFCEDDGPTRGHHINYLVKLRPNPRMNWSRLMQQAEIRRVLRGNAYIYVERSVSLEVEAFWLCDDATYNPQEDTYSIRYYIGNSLVKSLTVPANDVIHLRNTFSNDGGFTGVSTLRYANRVLDAAATQDQLTLETAAKGGKKKLVIQEQAQQNMGLGKVASSEVKGIADKMNDNFWEKDISYVPNAVDIKDYSQSLQELQLLDSRKFSVREVARLFGVPASMLMDDTNSSYNTPEAATLEFLSRTIAPLIREWETEFNTKVLTEDDFGKRRFHLCEKPLFRLDRTGQAAWDKARMETGVASINDLRAEQDMPKIENGDDHYVSTNLAIAGAQKLSE